MGASVGLNIRVDDKAVRAKLKSMGNMKFRTPLKQSGVYMQGSIGKRFRSARWKPLSSATIKMHPHRAGGKPLNDTGALKKSVTSQVVTRITGDKLIYGTNLKYAPMHNFGGIGGFGRKIPQREFLYFDKNDEEQVKRIFEDYVRRLGNG